jgi:hypothetical protein
MNVTYDAVPEGEIRLVYVRSVAVSGLPDALREQIGAVETVYSVHGEDGAQLALVASRDMAFALARQHEMQPMSVH